LIGAKVITARDIERSGASTLSELLRSSFDVRIRDLPGSPNPQIDMRGFGLFGDYNALALLDGMRMREYEFLTVNWSAIPLSSIKRIEILPASSAVLYGGGATGGAINIITKAPVNGSRRVDFGLGVASYNTREIHADGSVAGQNAGVRVYGSHYETNNFRDNNRVHIDNGQGDVRWTGETGSLDFKFGVDDRRDGLPGVLSEAQIASNRRQAGTPFDSATQHGGYLNLGTHTKVAFGELAVSMAYRKRDTASSFLVGTPFRNNIDTTVNVWTLTPRLYLHPRFGGWDNTLIVGLDFDDWKFDGNSGPAIVGRPHSTQRSAALYAQHTTTFTSQTTLSVGLRQQNTHYEVTDLANPSASSARERTLRAWDISARQVLAPNLDVYGRFGTSFRLPNVDDNFNPFFARVTLLEPQTARDREFGLEGKSSVVRYRAAVYRADIDNEIFFDPATLGGLNRQPTRREGIRLDANWRATHALELYVDYIYADARFRSGTAGGVPIAGKRVPISPRHTFNAGARWAISGSAHADVDLRYTGTSVFDADQTNTFRREIPAYTVVDVKLSGYRGAWLFSAGVRNLFDKKYFAYGVFTGRPTYSAFPAEERRMFVSAQYTLE